MYSKSGVIVSMSDVSLSLPFIYHNLSYISFHLRFSNLVILQCCFSKKRSDDDRMFILFYSFSFSDYEVLILVLRVNHMHILWFVQIFQRILLNQSQMISQIEESLSSADHFVEYDVISFQLIRVRRCYDRDREILMFKWQFWRWSRRDRQCDRSEVRFNEKWLLKRWREWR
jgi:hypothetical protein